MFFVAFGFQLLQKNNKILSSHISEDFYLFKKNAVYGPGFFSDPSPSEIYHFLMAVSYLRVRFVKLDDRVNPATACTGLEDLNFE